MNVKPEKEKALTRSLVSALNCWLPLSHELRTFFLDPPLDIIKYLRHNALLTSVSPLDPASLFAKPFR
jgi:hypothetical protein